MMKTLKTALGVLLLIISAPIVLWLTKGFDPDFLLEAVTTGLAIEITICAIIAFVLLIGWLFSIDELFKN